MATSPCAPVLSPPDALTRKRVQESSSDDDEPAFSLFHSVAEQVQELGQIDLQRLCEYLLENAGVCKRCQRWSWDRDSCFAFLPDRYCRRCAPSVRRHRRRVAHQCRLCDRLRAPPGGARSSDDE
jgi:hypothetical protein